MQRRPVRSVFHLAVLCLTAAFLAVRTALAAPTTPPPAPIEYSQETLDNGLQVIYAPLHQAPVVHVRVLYHVGSRDEKPDRQGFAHMFEHMMFRGSAHVPPEEHMKLIGMVGGYSNAFTSFDQTVYVNTLPSNQLEMALYLEADRMASFKVSEAIYKTERKVVAQEWAMGQNRPYGTMWEDFSKVAFTTHSYRWTPIGNMDHLQAAAVNELQDFFNTYYLPNNALLVIAGDFDTAIAKEMVKKYFAWVPRGPEVKRAIPAEPPQAEARTATTPKYVPLPAVMIGYHLPPYRSDDHYALGLLGQVLGSGRSARLNKLLVSGEKPLCVTVSAGDSALEDAGLFIVRGTVLQGRSAEEVQKQMAAAVADVVDKGVTAEELEKAKQENRVEEVRGRMTAEDLARQLGEEALIGGDANRVNTELGKIEAVTLADIQAVARKYLRPELSTTLFVKPDPLGQGARAAARAAEVSEAPVTPASKPVVARAVEFPAGYLKSAPVADLGTTPEFQKGQEFPIGPATLVVLPDHRLPLVDLTLVLRRGSHNEPANKEGVAGLTAEMLRRGSAGLSYQQLSEDLESRGIRVSFGDAGDHTNLSISCTTDQLDHAVQRAKEMLRSPAWSPEEFAKLKEQESNRLVQGQEVADTVAAHELTVALWPNSLMGRYTTPASVAGITLDDVKDYYRTIYVPEQAILACGGDITVAKARELAQQFLDGWQGTLAPEPDYAAQPPRRRIILVDRPEAKQAAIRMALRAYNLHNDDKFAGSLANMVLTGGINTRMGKYVRAQLGLVYGISGLFLPDRHLGTFAIGTDCKIENTAKTILAAFRVVDGMCSAPVAPAELSEAKFRVAGSMVMRMQSTDQQLGMRLEGMLNGYPADYYDKLPARLNQINTEDVRQVMDRYVDTQEMNIIVVAPASMVKDQLDKYFRNVEVLPMPSQREGATKPATQELLK